MTYDELIAKLRLLADDVTELQHGAKAVQALREIVKFHTPGVGQPYCSRCDVPYPCATIYAIEEQLK